MLKLTIYILISIASIGNLSANSDIFSIFDLEIPSIRQENWLSELDAIPYVKYAYKYDILFYLDEFGSVDSFSYESDHNNFFIEKARKEFESFKFYPAKYKGDPISFVLPASLQLETVHGKFSPRLELPNDEYNCAISGRLLEKALALNRFSLPAISRFPSFIMPKADNERIENYKDLIYRIEIDSVGKLIDFELISGSGKEFQAIIETPLLYAEFRPAIYNGSGFNAEFFVIFRLFGQIQSPTNEWNSDSIAEYQFPFQQMLIESRVVLDLAVHPPIPLNLPNWSYSTKRAIAWSQSLTVLAEIDSLGRISNYRPDKSVPNLFRKDIDIVLKDKLRFSPARNMNGKRVSFTGRLKIEFTRIRGLLIYPEWLPGPEK